MGVWVMWAAVAAAAIAGFLGWAWYIVPALGAVAAIGYLIHRPRAVGVIRRRPLAYPLAQWAVYSIAAGLAYALGLYLAGRL